MMTGVIDIGSNSVRAMCVSGGKIIYRGLITSRLGEGTAFSEFLSNGAIERTVQAVKELYFKLIEVGATEIYAFATEAVRSAKNGSEFTEKVYLATGLTVDVVSGKDEGELGLMGALCGNDGGIIDVGGASSEVTVASGGKIIYSYSMPLGAVRLKDTCGEDEDKFKLTVDKHIEGYGEIPKAENMYFIGGTASQLASVYLSLDKYDAEKIDGTALSLSDIDEVYNVVKNADIETRINKYHIQSKRADIIVGGIYLLKRIAERCKVDKITVTENDNMLGYLMIKSGGKRYGR